LFCFKLEEFDDFKPRTNVTVQQKILKEQMEHDFVPD